MRRSAVVAEKFWPSDRLALQATSGSDPLLSVSSQPSEGQVTKYCSRSKRALSGKSSSKD